MKTKKFCVIAFVSILTIGEGLGVSLSKLNAYTNLSLRISNVEALANPDQGGSSTSWDCWSQQKRGGDGYWRCGNPCEFVKGFKGTSSKGTCYSN